MGAKAKDCSVSSIKTSGSCKNVAAWQATRTRKRAAILIFILILKTNYMNWAKWRQFENFNFGQNVVWNEYSTQLDPSLPPEQLQQRKKQWYKDNIDPEFDLSWNPDIQGKHQHQFTSGPQSAQHQSNAPPGSYQDLPFLKKRLYDAENLLKVLFIFSALLSLNFTSQVALVVSILALYRQLKRPRWSKDYGRQLFINEFTHNLVYLGSFFFVHSNRILYNIPLIIHFWVGTAEYLNQVKGILYQRLQKYVEATRKMKEDLMNMKIRVEIFILPITIALAFFQQSSLFMILFYGNFVRIKYIVNARTQQQCAFINSRYLNPYANKPVVGFAIRMFQKFTGYMVKVK